MLLSSCMAGVMTLAALAADDLDRSKLEKSLADKDNKSIVQAIKDNEEAVLPFFDEYLEGGLAALEKGEPRAAAEESFAKGVAFAKLADEALGGSVFSNYANAFAAWKPEQQKQFREGQTEFRKGVKVLAEQPEQAVVHFKKSLVLCEPLGDAWGQAMCLSKIAAAHAALGNHAPAIEAATAAFEVNKGLHQVSAQTGDLIFRAECRAKSGKKEDCEKDLVAALALTKRIKDAKRGEALMKRCAEVYRLNGNKDLADAIEKDIASKKK